MSEQRGTHMDRPARADRVCGSIMDAVISVGYLICGAFSKRTGSDRVGR